MRLIIQLLKKLLKKRIQHVTCLLWPPHKQTNIYFHLNYNQPLECHSKNVIFLTCTEIHFVSFSSFSPVVMPPVTMDAMPEPGLPLSPSMFIFDWLFIRCLSSVFSASSWSISACRASMVSSNSLYTQSETERQTNTQICDAQYV